MRGGMKGWFGGLVLGSLLLVGVPGLASAQTRGYVGIGAGVNLPIGDLADVVKLGWLGQVTGGIMLSDMFGVRVNGTYGQNKHKAEGGLSIKYIAAMGDVVVSPTTGGGAAPYLLAGAGLLNAKTADNVSAFAWNAGGGVKFNAGSLALYVEGRFLSSKKHGFTSNMIPITAGVRFGGN